jgi:hypothetical protein
MLSNFQKDKTEVKIMLVATEPSIEKISPFVLVEGLDDKTIFDRLFKTGLDDHYFDLDGAYKGKSINGWGRLRIVNKKEGDNGFSVASIYTDISTQVIEVEKGYTNSIDMSAHIIFLKSQNRHQELYGMFGKIINYYEPQTKYLGISNVLKVEDDVEKFRLAVTKKDEKQIYLNLGVSDLSDYDFYNQIQNIIFHEKVHLSIPLDGIVPSGSSRKVNDEFFYGHALLVFHPQVSLDPHFKNTTYTYKLEAIRKYSCFVYGADRGSISSNSNEIKDLKSICAADAFAIGFTIQYPNAAENGNSTTIIRNIKTNSTIRTDCNKILDEDGK